MATPEHLVILKQGVKVWNEWRQKNPLIHPNLTKADLTYTDLRGADLRDADLGGATLWGADLGEAKFWGADLGKAGLWRANLGWADLRDSVLREADLREADLGGADLRGADLRGANLGGADLGRADLGGANLLGATLFETVIGAVNLSTVVGLNSCVHLGPSILDHRTLERSGPLPVKFLRGCGLPDTLIAYISSLLNKEQPIQFYTCFISYSAKDQAFAERLHTDLQDKGVRCWFAPKDLEIGAKTARELMNPFGPTTNFSSPCRNIRWPASGWNRKWRPHSRPSGRQKLRDRKGRSSFRSVSITPS